MKERSYDMEKKKREIERNYVEEIREGIDESKNKRVGIEREEEYKKKKKIANEW